MPAKLEQEEEEEEEEDTPGGEAAQKVPTTDLQQAQGADADNSLEHAEGASRDAPNLSGFCNAVNDDCSI